jgi:hypothetical protein
VRTRSLLVGVLLFATPLTACGDDVPSRNDFVAALQEITDPPVDRKLAECAYDALANDERLMRLAMTRTSLEPEDDDRLAKIFARCVLGPDAPTTVAPTTTR